MNARNDERDIEDDGWRTEYCSGVIPPRPRIECPHCQDGYLYGDDDSLCPDCQGKGYIGQDVAAN